MKSLLKYLLRSYLKIAAKIVLSKNKPIIIAVAGSLNKNFIKDSLSTMLAENGWTIAKTINNFNTEIGLPLSILGLNSGYNSYADWLPVIKAVPAKIFSYPRVDVMILEYGTSDPGDIDFLLSIARPDITVIGEITKRYLESFGSVSGLTEEFGSLVKMTKADGLVVLNGDNSKVASLSTRARARVETFGFQEDSDYRVVSATKTNEGQAISAINRRGIKKDFVISTFGRQHAYSAVAAWAVQDYLGGKNEKK